MTRWIEDPLTGDRRELCLIGEAGRGKSTVSVSVARQERKLGRLGGEFYFTNQQDRNERVIPDLARQLASWGDRRLRVQIASAVYVDHKIMQGTLEVQFQKLIREPLETLKDDLECPPLIMLLDGLDGCNEEYALRLLRLTGQGFATLPAAVKFIITSRPEQYILNYCDSEPGNSQLRVRFLDSDGVVEAGQGRDIERYLKRELPRMMWGWVKMPSVWPGKERLRLLIRLSGGQWIWVITVTRMLADRNFPDPDKQLDALLSSAPNVHGEHCQDIDLYAIYSKILNRACPLDSDPDLTLFRDTLGALCVVTATINIHTLTSLLAHPSSGGITNTIRTKVLAYLGVVLIVPDIEDDNPSRNAKPIKFINRPFEEYLTDLSQCETRFLIDIPEQHRLMAIRCIRHMNDLHKPNLCELDPTMLNSEIIGDSNLPGIDGLIQ